MIQHLLINSPEDRTYVGNKQLSNTYRLIKDGVFNVETNTIEWRDPLALFENKKSLYVRAAYSDIYDSILLSKKTRNVVTGVPGIGKSLFCLYFIWRYVAENTDALFLLEFVKDEIQMFGPNYHQMCTRLQCNGVQIPYFVDIDAMHEPAKNVGSFAVVFSFPHPGRFKQWMKNPDLCDRYVLPTWTLPDLQQLRLVCFPLTSGETVNYRFRRVGGVPRLVLQGDDCCFEDCLENALARKGAGIAESFFVSGFGMTDEEMSYTLVHIHPDQENYCTRAEHFTFASTFIWERLYRLNQRSIINKSVDYFNGGTGAYGGLFAGYHFENICHIALPITGKHFRISSLRSSEGDESINHVNEKTTIFVPSTVCNLSTDDWSRTPFERNVYYIPLKKNLESGDSFFLSDDGVLHVLQITVGKSHPVKAHGLGIIFNAFPADQVQTCRLVFVVPSQGQLVTPQNITRMADDQQVTRKTEVTKLFAENQWRLEYSLSIPE